jgi:hypothetical protein
MKRPKGVAIRRIVGGSAEYEMELKLRDQVLREPLGMSLFDEDLSGESADIHLGAFDGGKPRGCARADAYRRGARAHAAGGRR